MRATAPDGNCPVDDGKQGLASISQSELKNRTGVAKSFEAQAIAEPVGALLLAWGY